MAPDTNPAVNPPEHIPAVRDLVDVVLEIDRIDVPPFQAPKKQEGNVDPETDPEWWETYRKIEGVVQDHGVGSRFDIKKTSFDPENSRGDQHLWIENSAKWTKLDVKVYADGDVGIYAQYYDHSSTWGQLYRGRRFDSRPDPFTIGRKVASAELAILARATESCAEALDYWQTQLGENKYSQSQWAAIRGVGRQTVHDRVTEARPKVEE